MCSFRLHSRVDQSKSARVAYSLPLPPTENQANLVHHMCQSSLTLLFFRVLHRSCLYCCWSGCVWRMVGGGSLLATCHGRAPIPATFKRAQVQATLP
eukprot:9114848-Pyramimonas_sp.AAC.1